ncbi:MAG: DUF898 domain-containing protein [Hyphomonadaceae bacterium]|jgi:uncharacterized membrane protein YjgN (DUF898 family)|nr:DUF898 domain-containing protein [Hyphomonadaceae bacterium]
MSLADSLAAAPPAAASRITWVHPPGGFLGLSLLNGLLRILTLGVYHFWGKTEVRQRIWSAVRVDGEPLEYRGTGSELFRGFLIVFFLVLLPLGLITLVAPLLWGARPVGRGAIESLIWIVLFSLWGVGIHRARRYRLSRTRWRGIRAGLSGSSAPFAWTYLWTTLLIPLTLGWILPWRAARLHQALFNETHFGDKAFVFTGRAGPLYKRFWLVWVSAIVLFVVVSTAVAGVVGMSYTGRTAGPPANPFTWDKIAAIVAIVFAALLIFAMIRAWYSSRMFNYFASETTYQGCRFHLATTVPSLVWLVASNYLIRTLSLTLLSPIAEARATRYIIDRLSLEGPVEWQAIGQNPDALLTRGEGLAEAFNVDAF